MEHKKTLLITGGLGYIGSHTVVELLSQDYLDSVGIKDQYEIVIIDNLSNASENVLKRIEQVTNKKVIFHNLDILEK